MNKDGLSIEDAEASLLAAMGRQIQRKVNGPSGRFSKMSFDLITIANWQLLIVNLYQK